MSNQFLESVREFTDFLSEVDLDGVTTHLDESSDTGEISVSFFPEAEEAFDRLVEAFPVAFDAHSSGATKYSQWEGEGTLSHGAYEITIFRTRFDK